MKVTNLIKKKYRLKKIKEFNYMFRNGKRQNMPSLTLITTKSYLPYSRFGISISSKIGNAVVRNKIKRRLRYAISEFVKENPKFDNKNYIFVARAGIEKMSYQQIKQNVYALFKRGKNEIH